MSEVVKLERQDVIAIVTVNSPPVNALSAAVRGGIFECMKSAIADAEVKAIVLTCAAAPSSPAPTSPNSASRRSPRVSPKCLS